jgi:FixJ family two-component response regulator
MELSKRQAEVAERVARGFSNKRIATDLDLSIRTVEEHIRVAAGRLPPGEGNPRHRITLWFFHIGDVDN